MAKRLQLRRGTTTEHNIFTGAVGEVTIDTDKDTVVVHDGTTAGGMPLATTADITDINNELALKSDIPYVNEELALKADITYVNEELALKADINAIDTLNELRAKTEAIDTVWVSGYHTKGDGAFGSKIFEWDATSTEDDNGGTIIKLTSITTGRYKLKYSGIGNLNVKWFGSDGTYTNDTVALNRALLVGKSVYFNEDLYINRTIYVPSNIVLNGNNNSIIFDNESTSYASDVIFNMTSAVKTKICNIKFQGSTTVDVTLTTYTALNALFSMSDSFLCEISDCSIYDVVGKIARLNRSIKLTIDNIKIRRVAGAYGDPGSGFYASGLTKSNFNNIEAAYLGDHLFYLQGSEDTIVDTVSISNTFVKNSGQNGLTGGASLVMYNYCHNMFISNYSSTSCRSGIFINTKNGYTGAPGKNINIVNFNSRGDLNRGLHIEKNDTAPSSDFENIIISNSSMLNLSGGLGIEVQDTDGFSISNTQIADNSSGLYISDSSNVSITGCTSMNNTAGSGIYLNNVSKFAITGCVVHGNSAAQGIQIIGGEYGNVTGCTSYNNARNGLVISNGADRIYASNIMLLPTGTYNDTFQVDSDCTNCVFHNLTPRDEGNVMCSQMYGNSAPTEGYWNIGDRFINISPNAGSFEGWVCVTAGAPGTWKTFGTIEQ